MATYEITAPDGRTFEVTAPDGATQDQVLSYAQQQFSQMPSGQPQSPDLKQKVQSSFLGRVAQGMRDPIDAGAQLLPRGLEFVSSAGGLLPNKVSDYFGGEAKRVDDMNAKAEQEYQAARMATAPRTISDLVTGNVDPGFDGGRILGNVISPVNAGLARLLPITPAMTTMQKVVQGTTAGAAGGALQPINDLKDGQSFAWTKAAQIGLGGATGGIAVPLASKLTEGVARVINSRSPEITGARASLQTDEIIAKSLAEMGQRIDDVPAAEMRVLRSQVIDALKSRKQLDPAALLRKADFDALEIPYTQGQVTRDATQFARERNLRAAPGLGEPLLNRFTFQNQKLGKLLADAKGNASEAFPAGERISETLRNTDEAMSKQIGAAYSAARQASGKDLDVPLTGLAQDYAEVVRNFGDKVPSGVRNRFEELGLMSGQQKKVFSVEDAEGLLKVINDNVTSDQAANKALTTLRNSVKNAVLSADDKGGVFAAPREMAAKRFALQDAIPALKASADGSVAPDDFVRKYVANGKTNDVKALADLLRKTDAEAFDEAKAQIGKKLFKAAFGNNAAGDKLFAPERYAEELNNIGTEKLKAFFTQAEIDNLKRAGRVGAYINSTPTAAPVMGNPNGVWAYNMLSKIPGVPASAAMLSSVAKTIGNSRAVGNALNEQVPQKAAELTPEQIQLIAKALSLGSTASGSLAGSKFR